MESVNTVPFNSSVQDAESSGYERDCTFTHKITRQRIHIIVQVGIWVLRTVKSRGQFTGDDFFLNVQLKKPNNHCNGPVHSCTIMCILCRFQFMSKNCIVCLKKTCITILCLNIF
jgi:hypothetical protein